MSVVLGLTFGHDASVCVVVNGRIASALAAERSSRVKHAGQIDKILIDSVLAAAGVEIGDIDLACCGSMIASQSGGDWPVVLTADNQIVREVRVPSLAALDIENSIPQFVLALGDVRKPLRVFPHHLCHAAAAYYSSPFDQAACFTLDASGPPAESSLFSFADGERLWPLLTPNVMIGCTYGHFTELLGLGPQISKAGTLMGLAPYGEVLESARRSLETYKLPFQRQIYSAFDPNRHERYHDHLIWNEISGYPPMVGFTRETSDGQEAMNIAASIQFVFEEVIIHHANALYERTRAFNGGNLCLSGGSFLNCDVNSALLSRTPFERIHLFPGCGDDGIAVGAALCGAHLIAKDCRHVHEPHEIIYLGPAHPTPDIGEPLDIDRIAAVLEKGGIVAWHQGRAEFGPRALGGRSLLADPRSADMRDRINRDIKRREWFRPFAPVVMEERADQWFEIDRPSPYMLFKHRVRFPARIPAVTHVDGSARVQTVRREHNSRYYDLLAAFERRTGTPVLLNTSLNVNGEPLAERPEDAVRFYQTTGVDALVIDDRMVIRPPAA